MATSANTARSHDVSHLRLGGREVQEGGKMEICDEHPVLPSVSTGRPHSPEPPLQPCSELAGVFLYNRPILWDARKAMEAFEGHRTKAQRQKGRL